MWNWLTTNWAKVNFGQHARTFLRVMETVAFVLRYAMPLVESLEEIKRQWVHGMSDYERLVELVRKEAPSEEYPGLVVSRVYDQQHVGETLFGVAVWLVRNHVPSSAPYAKLAVELAYLLLAMRNKFR